LRTLRSHPHLRTIALRREPLALAQQLSQHDVAHAEAERREIDVPERLQQRVIASAAANGAELSLRVEELEHNPRVVREPTNDLEIDRDPVENAEALKAIEIPSQVGYERLHIRRLAELLLDHVERDVAHERQQAIACLRCKPEP